MYGIILKSYFPLSNDKNSMSILLCRHKQYNCDYMYLLFTRKRKLSVENITFYILKNVQNINTSL